LAVLIRCPQCTHVLQYEGTHEDITLSIYLTLLKPRGGPAWQRWMLGSSLSQEEQCVGMIQHL
jgi:hypothetical protein